MKLKKRHFESVSDSQRESQVVIDRFRENHLECFREYERSDGISVHIHKVIRIAGDGCQH